MSLFQRRPQGGETIQFYTLGQSKAVLIVGLGNPGKKYDGTRHNIGFACVDAFVKASEFDGWIEKKDLKCHMTSGRLGDTQVIVIKPTTFMNLSGEAAQAVAHFYKIPAERVLAVYDELDIPFGQIRLRTGGGSAGHNGVKSLVEHLGETFGRVRIGIGPKEPEQIDSADFVLGTFKTDQQAHFKELTREASAIISEYAFGDGQLATETRTFIV
jgi:peptidyl-tRNA hydrolase, PTH1 family